MKQGVKDMISGLQTSLNKIKVNHGKTLQFQAMLRAFEAKDRNVIEHNYERVNFWSMIHLLAMVATAIFQVKDVAITPRIHGPEIGSD